MGGEGRGGEGRGREGRGGEREGGEERRGGEGKGDSPRERGTGLSFQTWSRPDSQTLNWSKMTMAQGRRDSNLRPGKRSVIIYITN